MEVKLLKVKNVAQYILLHCSVYFIRVEAVSHALITTRGVRRWKGAGHLFLIVDSHNI